MKINRVIYEIQPLGFRIGRYFGNIFGFRFTAQIYSQIYSTFLADFLKVFFHAVNYFRSRLTNGVKTGFQFGKFFALTPSCYVPEAVFACFNAEICAYRKGNALGFNLLRSAVFLFGRFCVLVL